MSKVLSVIIFIFSLNSAAQSGGFFELFAVYGEDNRIEPFTAGAMEVELSKSVAGRVSLEHLQPAGGNFKMTRKTLGEEKCRRNRFAEQTLGPTCSAFLVRSDLLVTAGHCMPTVESCTNNVWIFDYALTSATDQSYRIVSPKNIYRCKQILAKGYKDFGNVDYAIIQLDRPVMDRNYLVMDFNHDSPSLQTLTFAAGFPSGLPMKITVGGRVLKNDNPYAFDTDLDIFQGNSGSPVIDQNTGKVIGITSHGHEDYKRDGADPSCKMPRICLPGDNCYLSTASRVSNLEEDFKKILDSSAH